MPYLFELTEPCRRANEESILAVQIFDQKKFKKKDQGFLGVVNVRVGSVIDLDAGGDGTSTCAFTRLSC
jgi:E3 ubiquitin-protein ligase NEDD4